MTENGQMLFLPSIDSNSCIEADSQSSFVCKRMHAISPNEMQWVHLYKASSYK